MDAIPHFRDQLVASGLLVPTGVDGLYGRSGLFEDVIGRIEARITDLGASLDAEVLRFPPAVTRSQLETSGYMKSFPQLAGTVHSFCGDDHDHIRLLEKLGSKQDWTGDQKATEIALTPAACYPLYPMLALRGPVSREGHVFDVQSYCFRHEPSADPARMQMFRMREFVCVGAADQVQSFRLRWIERGEALVESLEMPYDVVPANDPFFGRAGKMMKANQRSQALKLELVIPVANPEPTACLSFNYHQDHFADTWGLSQEDGLPVHTACVGFGLERMALALFKTYGLDSTRWPASVRARLWN